MREKSSKHIDETFVFKIGFLLDYNFKEEHFQTDCYLNLYLELFTLSAMNYMSQVKETILGKALKKFL